MKERQPGERHSRPRRLAVTAAVGMFTITLAACHHEETGGHSQPPASPSPGASPKHPVGCFETFTYGGAHHSLSEYGKKLEAQTDAAMQGKGFNAAQFDTRWIACPGANLGGIEDIMKRMIGDEKNQRHQLNAIQCGILALNKTALEKEGVLTDDQFKTMQEKYNANGLPNCGVTLTTARSGGPQHHKLNLQIPLPAAGEDTFTTDQTVVASPAAYTGGATTVLAEGAPGYVPLPDMAAQWRPLQLGDIAAGLPTVAAAA